MQPRSLNLLEWFGHIANASEELREEFEAMAESGATPRNYGLRVQSHPVLMVTSPLKMRSARNLQHWSASGDEHIFQDGLKIDAMSERKRDVDLKDSYSIGCLLSVVDLDKTAWTAEHSVTRKTWQVNSARYGKQVFSIYGTRFCSKVPKIPTSLVGKIPLGAKFFNRAFFIEAQGQSL